MVQVTRHQLHTYHLVVETGHQVKQTSYLRQVAPNSYTREKNNVETLSPSFKKCNVENRRVIVDELEEKHFDGERIFVFRIGSTLF